MTADLALPDPDTLLRAVEEPVARERPVPPKDRDWWVFGYGSLMWNPGFPHHEGRSALLRGYHRRFCVFSLRYRGTPERPGLVLGLAPGGACRGMAFRVPASDGEEVLDYLWEREMVTGVYRPRWLRVDTPQGPAHALSFVADPGHGQYCRLNAESTAALIRQGVGQRGPCRDYLINTERHLREMGIRDRMLTRLIALLEEPNPDEG
ncbi:gamma-glutamylcyclotransferase [Aquibaculum sediminis]|uniref:gamma-glutamylcyclotransferase n=1 Tax=Aquibaculum sediminis TaxID=3231907 RepID=UPI0034564EF2